MCMIAFAPAGVYIPDESLSNSAMTNDDGHGWAVAKGSTMLIGKSMDFEKALDGFTEARAKMPGAVTMFHSRWATHGELGEYNVHPFWVGGEDSGTVMSHNGILPNRYLPTQWDRRSDTRKFVDQIGAFASNKRGVPSRTAGGVLSRMIGGGNKLVFLSVKSGQPRVRIINADAGTSRGGVWYSNTGFMPSAYVNYRNTRWSPSKSELSASRALVVRDEFWDEISTLKDHEPWPSYAMEMARKSSEGTCPFCDCCDISRNNTCLNCFSCLDCFQGPLDCDCWYGSDGRCPYCTKTDAECECPRADIKGQTYNPGGWDRA